ncbi:hypothetical protein QYE76_048497 [Lolium multiflorum]|uniref:Integrase catalytic domain-containing protein n=1 Tax=Lolium multiflorum TaxID=4521 RepID=A0AAD8WHD0_LOLMU|nr:hypothetical protein QYE76_048497 [Lolium multiflorum]
MRIYEEPMEMTFGRFHFRVGREGSHRLEIPVSLGSSAADSDFSESSSSFKMGAEEISPPCLVKSATSGKFIKIFSSMSCGSSANSNISSDSDSADSFDFIDRSTSIREVFADLYDGVTDPEEENKATIYHQVCAIGEPSHQEDETSEAFDDLGCERLSFLDAYSGYNQIRLKEEDEVKTAFITPYGVFSSNNAFGLKNAEQHIADDAYALPQIGKNVQVYIDDVVITTKKGSTLIEDLKETFDNLDKFCLKLNPTKCSFGVPWENFSGFWSLSRFVARLGEKALPLYTLIKQGEKFEWNEEADRAFEDLKRTISTPPILVAPKEKEPLLIVTDNGSNFTSKEFKAYCAEVGIKLHFASVAHPQTNGQVEKANGIICNGIKKRLLTPLEKA